MSMAEALVTDFNREAANTRTVLEAVPEDRLGWKPHEKSMSLGQLAGHIAESPSWARGIMEEELDFASAGADYQPFVATSKSALLETFDAKVREFAEVVGGRDDPFLSKTWTMRNGEKILLQLPREAALRGTAIHHAVHHRGQLTVYLRLLEVPVPSTYGPTADNQDRF